MIDVGDGGPGRVVLITGCSTGIGHAAARRFADRGWIVYASARRIASIDDLVAAGCRAVQLDVTDEASMRSAVTRVVEESGRIDALVNNAGYGRYGPLEQVALSEFRRQFETNVFGPIRLMQLVLPTMRRQRSGRIVNISSIAGRMSYPGGAPYHASKHALEAVTDALRLEVGTFGVKVVLIESGPVRTRWGAGAAASVADDEPEADGDDAYAPLKVAIGSMLQAMSTARTRLVVARPEAIARTIVRAAESAAPRARYRPGPFAKAVLLARWCCPDRVWDAAVLRRVPRLAT